MTSEILADGTVGYLRLDGFSSSAADDFHGQLAALVDAGVRRIIFDLRDDPGGFVDAAETIASQFVASGPVYWESTPTDASFRHQALPGGVATDPAIEVVVLVNGGSASASEIVAGALQDTGRATPGRRDDVRQGHHPAVADADRRHGRLPTLGGQVADAGQALHPRLGLTPDVPVDVPAESPDSDVVLERALELLGAPTS